jgi:hypothetical protein
MAADGTRRERHVANANPTHNRPAQPVVLVAGACSAQSVD